ncbi:MAG: glycosyltransferase [Desulfosarcina sp.]|nr:glycosyltransferase [Desulfosarcina sp.]
MHITFVTTHFPPSQGFGGVCESSHGLSRALARAGVTVDVITSDSTKGARIPFSAFTESEAPNLRIHPFKYLASEKSCFSFNAIRVLRKHVPQSDLIHVNGIFAHPVSLGAWVARRQRKPHLIAIRNGLDPWMFKIRRVKKMIGFKLFVQNDLEGANCIHATAEQEINACRTFGLEGPFTIIPNGINPHSFENLPAPEVAEERWPSLQRKTVVLFLSRLSPQKGLDLLIPGWDDIKQKYPEAFLVIAGPDYMGFSNEVRQLARRSAYPESILFTGSVWGEHKLALYSRADIFVLPSYSENFGNVIAEALVCGTPVVTTQATPWKDIEKTNCGRWIPVDKQSIIEALGEMISMSDSDRRRMGQRGRKLILDNFTWDIAARKMITVYRAIIDGDRIPLHPNPWNF